MQTAVDHVANWPIQDVSAFREANQEHWKMQDRKMTGRLAGLENDCTEEKLSEHDGFSPDFVFFTLDILFVIF